MSAPKAPWERCVCLSLYQQSCHATVHTYAWLAAAATHLQHARRDVDVPQRRVIDEPDAVVHAPAPRTRQQQLCIRLAQPRHAAWLHRHLLVQLLQEPAKQSKSFEAVTNRMSAGSLPDGKCRRVCTWMSKHHDSCALPRLTGSYSVMARWNALDGKSKLPADRARRDGPRVAVKVWPQSLVLRQILPVEPRLDRYVCICTTGGAHAGQQTLWKLPGTCISCSISMAANAEAEVASCAQLASTKLYIGTSGRSPLLRMYCRCLRMRTTRFDGLRVATQLVILPVCGR